MRHLLKLMPLIVLAGCSTMDYKPVTDNSLEAWSKNGCKDKERASFDAQIKLAKEDSVLLWDGENEGSELMAEFPNPSIKEKVRGKLGDSKFEVSNKLLTMIQREADTINITLECRGKKKTPEVVRYTYDDDGERKTFEF